MVLVGAGVDSVDLLGREGDGGAEASDRGGLYGHEGGGEHFFGVSAKGDEAVVLEPDRFGWRSPFFCILFGRATDRSREGEARVDVGNPGAGGAAANNFVGEIASARLLFGLKRAENGQHGGRVGVADAFDIGQAEQESVHEGFDGGMLGSGVFSAAGEDLAHLGVV